MKLKGWNICPLICYDLRFPVWSRNTLNDNNNLDYDLLVYLANWPASRINVWKTLLEARALENLSYVIGVNRTGTDGSGIDYNGHSNIFDFKGNRVFSRSDKEETNMFKLDFDSLREFRRKFPAHYDSDPFKIMGI